MKEIELRGGVGFGMIALVDDEDYDVVMTYSSKWYFNKKRGYAFCTLKKVSGKSTGTIDMHRVVLGFPKSGMHSDHMNGEKLDNRKSNLRICPPGINRGNMVGKARARSEYWGVSLIGKLWYAKIASQGVTYNLGLYKTPEDAARAYNIKSRQLRGSSFTVNDIPSPFRVPDPVVHNNKYIYLHKPSMMYNVRFAKFGISCGYFDTIEKARRIRDIILCMADRGRDIQESVTYIKKSYREIRRKNCCGVYKYGENSTMLRPGQGNPLIECACGCGKMRRKYNNQGYPKIYIHGHNNSKQFVK
jgi:hypothetical protein